MILQGISLECFCKRASSCFTQTLREKKLTKQRRNNVFINNDCVHPRLYRCACTSFNRNNLIVSFHYSIYISASSPSFSFCFLSISFQRSFIHSFVALADEFFNIYSQRPYYLYTAHDVNAIVHDATINAVLQFEN